MEGNVLYGKKYVACGDSFTEGDFNNSPVSDNQFEDGLYAGCNKVYPYYIGRRNNMEVINLGICGSTLTNGGSNPLCCRLDAIPLDADYITIKIGINDGVKHQKMPLGTIDDTENTTFYGAWNCMLDYLTDKMPYAKIGIIVSNGMDTADQAVATIECAKKWGIAYLDLATDEKLPVMLRTLRTDVCEAVKERRIRDFAVAPGTNHHPNAKAHEFESYIIENWMRGL